jgi:hypothetical protein
MKIAKIYQKDYALYWDVYIICNVLILSNYCVTIKNELPMTFVSLGSEVASVLFCLEELAECSVLSRRISRVAPS